MRILGVSKKWEKLQQPEWTTFRFTRKDRDWCIGEVVHVFYKNRSPQIEKLGVAEIIGKETRRIFKTRKLYHIPIITTREAIKDGFTGWGDMALWLVKTYGHERFLNEPMNKLTLRWINEPRG